MAYCVLLAFYGVFMWRVHG